MSYNYATAELFLTAGERRLEMDGHIWLATGNDYEPDQPDERSVEVSSPASLNLNGGEVLLTITYNVNTRVVISVSSQVWTPPQEGQVAGDWDGVDYEELPGITIIGEIPQDDDDDN